MHNVKNNSASALASQLSIDAVTMTVGADVFPLAPFYLTIVDGAGSSLEVVEVTGKNALDFTVVRAYEGTNQTHPAGRAVELRMMAQHIIELQDAAAVVRPAGNWVTDTKNLREANASGKKVVLAAGTFYLEGDGTEIIKKQNMARWDGAGLSESILKIRSTVPLTRDVFRCIPPQVDEIGYRNRGLQLSNFAIVPETYTTRCARHAIHLDLNDAASWFTSQFDIHHLHLDYTGGRSFYASNTETDGYFCGGLEKCLIWSGVQMIGAGDSLYFEKNTIAGENIGIEITQVGGANVVSIANNNITARGGAMKLNTDRVKILDNNIEIYANGGTAPATEPAAIIHITGYVWGTTTNARIEGNTVLNILGTSAAACKIENCNLAKISNNRFHGGSGGAQDFIIAASCTATCIYPDNQFYNSRVTNSGTGTVYVS